MGMKLKLGIHAKNISLYIRFRADRAFETECIQMFGMDKEL